jgi:lipopolysaccharide cholinephosphotransferase
MSLYEIKENSPASPVEMNHSLRQAQLKMLGMLEAIDKICQLHQLDYWLEGGTLLGAIRHQGFIPWDDDLDISMPRESFEAFLKIAPTELPTHLFVQTPRKDPGFFNYQVPMKIRDKTSRLIEHHETDHEPYQQGIFIDVYPFDKYSRNAMQRKFSKWLGKKILRLLKPKFCTVKMGHHELVYKMLSNMFSTAFLLRLQKALIDQGHRYKNAYLGCGYDTVKNYFMDPKDIYPLKKAQFERLEFNIPNNAERLLTQYYGDYLTLPAKNEQVPKHFCELIPEL